MKQRKVILLGAACFLLSGCIASNMTQMVEALSKDPATVCIVVTTPYGGLVDVRTNPNGQGNEITGQGGGCVVKNDPGSFTPPPAAK